MDIKSRDLSKQGKDKIDWASRSMTVLQEVNTRFSKEKPLKGIRIAACLHVTAETGVLMRVLKAGGAQVRLCASNPLSTQDDVAASLAMDDGIEVFAIRGVEREKYYQHIRATLEHKPQITMDDGADLVQMIHTEYRDLLAGMMGGTEETTTGVIRLKSMARESVLTYPVIAVNDAKTKHLFDNRYGTGQSTIDGIMRATNRLLSGSTFVVCGYGWCGRGVAMRAAGMGARVIVTEVDPFRALEAVMDGYQVMPIEEASALGDFFCTVTGNKHAIGGQHMEKMKSGAMICNAGHFNVELDIGALQKMAVSQREVRKEVEEYTLSDGRTICLLGEGRLVNLAAAEGHPADVMDMSFANQALSAEHIVKHGSSMKSQVYVVPEPIDRQVVELKLKGMGIAIDSLTQEQSDYQQAWKMGT